MPPRHAGAGFERGLCRAHVGNSFFLHGLQQGAGFIEEREEQGQIKQVNDLPLAGLYSA